MIQNIDDQTQAGSVTETHVFAVVASEKARATEMERYFAVSGEPVEMIWYSDARQLRAQARERKGRFEAVILFADSKAQGARENDANADAEAEALREWLAGTPLIEAA